MIMQSSFNSNIVKYYDESVKKTIIINTDNGFSYYDNTPSVDYKQFSDNHKQTKLSPNFGNKTRDERNNEKSDQKQNEWMSVNSNNNYDTIYGSKLKLDSSAKLDKSFIRNGNIRVIGQLDKSVILCVVKSANLLIAFDQHAVHERVRYERIVSECYNADGSVKSIQLLPPVRLRVDCPQLAISIEKYNSEIKRMIGFGIINDKNCDNYYLLTHIPSVCSQCALSNDTIVHIIKELVTMLSDKSGSIGALTRSTTNTTTTTTITTTPTPTPKLLETLQSIACHGAIRFGDALKLQDCQKLIYSLSRCKSCFRCAHGRPNVALLSNLAKLN